jgi:vacuolar-type H+-ATPase subunit I/STV1
MVSASIYPVLLVPESIDDQFLELERKRAELAKKREEIEKQLSSIEEKLSDFKMRQTHRMEADKSISSETNKQMKTDTDKK